MCTHQSLTKTLWGHWECRENTVVLIVSVSVCASSPYYLHVDHVQYGTKYIYPVKHNDWGGGGGTKSSLGAPDHLNPPLPMVVT